MEETQHWLSETAGLVDRFVLELRSSELPGPAIDAQHAAMGLSGVLRAVIDMESSQPEEMQEVPHAELPDLPLLVRQTVREMKSEVEALKARDVQNEDIVDADLSAGANALTNYGRKLLAVYDPQKDLAALAQARADLNLARTKRVQIAAERDARHSAAAVQQGAEVLKEQRQELADFKAEQGAALALLRNRQGAQSQQDLAKRFETLGSEERTMADKLRRATLAAVGSAPIALVTIALLPFRNAPIVGAGVSLGIAGLALYLGRLADGHMKVSRWAQTLGVQALGVHHYADLIDDPDARVRVLEAFGIHAYLGQPSQDPSAEVPPSTVAELERLTRTVADAAARAQAPSPKR